MPPTGLNFKPKGLGSLSAQGHNRLGLTGAEIKLKGMSTRTHHQGLCGETNCADNDKGVDMKEAVHSVIGVDGLSVFGMSVHAKLSRQYAIACKKEETSGTHSVK